MRIVGHALLPVTLLVAASTESPVRGEEAARGRAPTDPVASAPADANPELDIGGLAERAAGADLVVVQGLSMKGKARFEQVDSGVKVAVEVQGAQPGKKAVHVHEKGDCSDIIGKSMGEHFAPRGEPHGLPTAPRHHVGDLGNIEIDESGGGRLEILARDATLEREDPLSLLDRAIVIHRQEDRGTPPAGDSGDPIACGVIKLG